MSARDIENSCDSRQRIRPGMGGKAKKMTFFLARRGLNEREIEKEREETRTHIVAALASVRLLIESVYDFPAVYPTL